jgi:hypothetical protein
MHFNNQWTFQLVIVNILQDSCERGGSSAPHVEVRPPLSSTRHMSANRRKSTQNRPKPFIDNCCVFRIPDISCGRPPHLTRFRTPFTTSFVLEM